MDRPPSRDLNNSDLPRQNHVRNSEESKATRTSDPMSFSSILSSNAADPPKTTTRPQLTSKQSRRSSNTPNGDTPSSSMVTRKSYQKNISSANDYPGLLRRPVKPEVEPTISARTVSSTHKAPLANSGRDNERVKKEMAKIDAMELSDIDSPSWATAKKNYAMWCRKRFVEIEEIEDNKRKVMERYAPI